MDYVKTLKVPVICFPRGIKDYKNYCEIVKPNAVNIDYDVDPHEMQKLIKIPIQGGLDPKILLTDKDNLKKKRTSIWKYLKIIHISLTWDTEFYLKQILKWLNIWLTL